MQRTLRVPDEGLRLMIPEKISVKDGEGMYPKSPIILIGTVHSDPRGYERTRRLLARLQPEMVTVEISAFSVRYRADHGARWLRLFEEALPRLPEGARGHPAIRRVAAQIGTPFEWRAAHAHGRRHGVPWRPIDLSAPARQHLPLYPAELLDPENLQKLWETPGASLEEQTAAEYERARLAATRPWWRPRRGNGALTILRERTMAARLRKLAQGGRRVVHLGGWEHQAAWEDGGGVAQLLSDLKPVRILLDESDIWSEPVVLAGDENTWDKAQG
jgi:hypothetical protein